MGSERIDPAWPLAEGQLRLEPVIAAAPPGRDPLDLVDPFLGVGDRGTFSRALLAEIVGPDGRAVQTVVLKLQSDEYPLVGEGESARWNNPAIEQSWARETLLLERCGAARASVPAIVEALPRSPGAAARLPPTLYCKRRRAFFPACCPTCGGPLSDVRDNRLLEDRGLPRHDRSMARFVGCPACLERGDVRLWTLVKDARAAAAGVGDQTDLFTALGPFVQERGARPGSAAALPCLGCTHVPSCYPEGGSTRGDVVRALVPISFYETRALALDVLHFHYDEAVALVGGATFDEVARQVMDPGRVEALGRVAAAFAQPRQYLFAQDMAGKAGLEVLALKLGLFRQLCEAVAAIHRHTLGPHLSITPDRALARLEDRRGLPNLWNLSLMLVGLGNASPRPLPAGAADDLALLSYDRPRLVSPLFAAPPIRDAALPEQPGTLTLRAVTAAGGERIVIQADLEASGFDLGGVGDKDVLQIAVMQGRPPLALSMVGLSTGFAGRALRVRSVPMMLGRDDRAVVDQLIGQALARARFTVYPCLHVPCDVYALGMMLFTTVLAGPSHPVADVAASALDVAGRLELWARERPDAGDEQLRREAAGLLSAGGEEGPFARRRLFAHPDRHPEAVDQIPAGIWLDVLLIALRAITTIRGFSVCRGYSDFDPAHPEVKVEFLLQLVAALSGRVEAALFGLPGRRRELRAAIARVTRRLNLEGPGKVE